MVIDFMKDFKEFNKLVRDKIPEILDKNGCEPEVETMLDYVYADALDQKLLEEANEVVGASTKSEKIEEIADVLEVIYAIVENLGVSQEEVEQVRRSKKDSRGGFDKKLLLKRAIVVESLK